MKTIVENRKGRKKQENIFFKAKHIHRDFSVFIHSFPCSFGQRNDSLFVFDSLILRASNKKPFYHWKHSAVFNMMLTDLYVFFICSCHQHIYQALELYALFKVKWKIVENQLLFLHKIKSVQNKKKLFSKFSSANWTFFNIIFYGELRTF